MIRKDRQLKNQRGHVLAEHAVVLAAIVGILLVVVSRVGFETSSVFDQLGKTFPRSSQTSGKRPGKRPKRAPSSPTATPDTGAPAPAAAKAPAKRPGAGSRGGSGGGGLSQSKRDGTPKGGGSVSSGATSKASTGSAGLTVLIGN